MINSRQRAQLRGLAVTADTILHVGKGGVTENIAMQANNALEAREIVKGRVLENAGLTPREVAENLATATKSEIVQTIGSKFVLYRESEMLERDKRIKLVK
ncbi:MAG: YhbY family RNA-binding protein [Oscillospiraceae bacterium]|jgi:RNA-binding protein|nr:YhbY family RNA-binding protein [Oscillospiraceae bacterium]